MEALKQFFSNQNSYSDNQPGRSLSTEKEAVGGGQESQTTSHFAVGYLVILRLSAILTPISVLI